MYLLDTNIISAIIRGEPPVMACFREALSTEATIVLSPIVYYEIQRGLLHRDAREQMRRFERLVSGLKWCDLIKEDFDRAAELWAARKRQGRHIADADLLIAAQAGRLGAVLVTDNVRHLDGLGMILENWRARL